MFSPTGVEYVNMDALTASPARVIDMIQRITVILPVRCHVLGTFISVS